MLHIEIDAGSGFCFGVTTAIKKAEEELGQRDILYCLGDIVHNSRECERLRERGLVIIDHETFATLRDVRVLLRAHGEPPSTYEIARRNNITLVDATCPVVLNLQQRISRVYHEMKNPQIVIYGKHGHAEVLGLVGQTNSEAIVISDISEVDKVDLTRNTYLFSQTTKPLEGFQTLIDYNRRQSSVVTTRFAAAFRIDCPGCRNLPSATTSFSSSADSKAATVVCFSRPVARSMPIRT